MGSYTDPTRGDTVSDPVLLASDRGRGSPLRCEQQDVLKQTEVIRSCLERREPANLELSGDRRSRPAHRLLRHEQHGLAGNRTS